MPTIDPVKGSRDVPARDPAGPDPEELSPLVHSDLHVPHRRLRVTALHQLPTSDGVAFTAELHLDATPVGTIENDGHGGATMFRSRRPDLFGWRHMEQFVAQCRHNGEPADEEAVLNGLVDEFDLTREIERVSKAGLTLIRLMSPQGWCLTIRTIAAANSTQLTDLAVHLSNDPAAVPGGIWQIWTTGCWQHVATLADPRADQRSAHPGEPSA